MKITVASTKKAWTSPDGKIGIWEVLGSDAVAHLTFSKVIGEAERGKTFEVEEYDKSGKVYIRLPKSGNSFGGGTKEFKADPVKQESIEWQACLKAAVETVRDWHQQYGSDSVKLPDYKKQIVDCLVTYTQAIQKKPNQASDEQPF